MTKASAPAIKSLPRGRSAKKISEPRDGETDDTAARQKSSLPSTLAWFGIISLIVAGIAVVVLSTGVYQRGAVAVEPPSKNPIPQRYSASRSFEYLVELCDFGPRPSGSIAMTRQQDYLERFFTERGGTVTRQAFQTRHPDDGSAITMTNLIASWYPDRPTRFLFCAHYDTRPYPDRDRENKRGYFVGANDGASGTAGLMELSNQFEDLPSDIGIDLVLFDGEEFVWQEGRDRYFIGSTYFAENYRNNPPAVPYQAGILFDMIGDKELKLYYEVNSLRFAKKVANSFWNQARKLGVRAFVPRARHELRDDHLPINQIAKVPTIDVIDFDYPRPGIGAPSYWHTQQDIPGNCSGESIAAVVWVAHQWILSQSSVGSASKP